MDTPHPLTADQQSIQDRWRWVAELRATIAKRLRNEKLREELAAARAAGLERRHAERSVCEACRQAPQPTYVVWDLPGVGRVAACADSRGCRVRAQALGIWCVA